MLSPRQFTSSRWSQSLIGTAAAEYLRLVWHTNRMVIEPADVYEHIDKDLPVIIAMWHGQHFLMPFIKRAEHRAMALISRHRDGAINAAAARRLGIGSIRGSGTHGTDFSAKGGIFAFRAILAALKEGYNIGLTADVPKVARVAGLGVIKLAQVSGRPIYPVAIATSRRLVLDNWDRTTINLPFGHGGGVAGAPIRVPAQADHESLERMRRALEEQLNVLTRRAYELADGRGREQARG